MFPILFSLLVLSFSPAVWAVDREFILPETGPSSDVCRAGAGFNLAACLNTIVRLKDGAREKSWRVTIKPGTYSLKDAILLFDVANLEIRGEPGAAIPVLRASGLPVNRLQHQYFSILIVNAQNVTIHRLNFFGELRAAQRTVGVCATAGKVTSGIVLSGMMMKDYPYFNVVAGNAPEGNALNTIQTYLYPPSHPLKPFVEFLKASSENRYCGGDLNGLTFKDSLVKMKSVAFYLVPPTARTTDAATIPDPLPVTTTVPAWYATSEAASRKVTGVVLTNNRFENDLASADQAKANQYHSAMKLHWSSGTRITHNVINAASLPNAFESGAAINVAPGMVDVLIENNTIELPAGLKHPFGINLNSYYDTHALYGLGDKRLFGAVNRVTIRKNNLKNGVIRFQDCCVQVENKDFDPRPYCRERDDLVSAHTNVERIVVQHNSLNGTPYMDHNLLWRVSAREPAWRQHYEAREAAGLGGIRCRRAMGVSYHSKDGEPR